MACILKLPSSEHQGVITFTTQERDRFIVGAGRVEAAVGELRSKWLVGLHHNWHDFAFRYNPLFDFSMAGESDLVERDGRPFSLLPLDACNFSPPDFHAPAVGGEKLWDVLTVGRPVFFKRLPLFLETVRRLYDRGQHLRVLCLCPLPPYRRSDRSTVFYELEQRYTEMFTPEERKLFNLWVPRHDYPFPLDLSTLAFLYRSSRVFVHTANDERRCRVAAYAWCTGLPVIAMDAVASLLPAELRRRPYWFKVDTDDGYAAAIVDALEATRGAVDFAAVRDVMSDEGARPRLVSRLKALLAHSHPAATNLTASDFSLDRLDIRLGRHFEYQSTTNALRLPLELFVADLASGRLDDRLTAAARLPDPERALEEALRAEYDSGRLSRLARAHQLSQLRQRAERVAHDLQKRARTLFGRA